MRTSFMALSAALLALTPASSPAAITPASDPVLYWADQMAANQTSNRIFDTRSIAMVTVALHDAISATSGNISNRYLTGVTASGGDTRAAAAQAAFQVLSSLYPAKTAQFAAARDQQLALIPDGAAKLDGIATGQAVGLAVVAARAGDGSTAVVSYTPSGEIGRWAPTGPTGFVAPQWGSVTPWLMTSGSQFRAPPPPDLTSAEYAASFNEVALIGAANSAVRTADQTAAAQFWATTPGNPMLRLALQLAEGRGLSTIENAQIFALLGVITADAAIATWDSKLHYDFWRPITAIQQAQNDGNPLTSTIAGWQPLLSNPAYPGYTSGIAGVVGADAIFLQQLFGEQRNMCLAHGTNAALDRCWADFDALISDLSNSRIWGGIHFDFDMTAGFAMSRSIVANALAANSFTPVPDVKSWVLMLLGFGLVGASLRRRNDQRRQEAQPALS